MSIAILSFGLTAILVVYLTALRWAEEIRIDMTSLHSARAVIYDAGILTDENDINLNMKNSDTPVEGFINDYYVVRSFTDEGLDPKLSSIGQYVKINVKVYYGGNQLTGQLVQDINCSQFLLAGYNP